MSKIYGWRIVRTWRGFVVLVLVALMLMLLSPIAHAADPITAAPPDGTVVVNGFRLKQIEPKPGRGIQAGHPATFRIDLYDVNGFVVKDAKLKMIASRDYSGQVHSDANGPRDPDQTLDLEYLQPDYVGTLLLPNNGDWTFRVVATFTDGSPQTVWAWRLPVSANTQDTTGPGIEWLLVPGILILAAFIVTIVRRRDRSPQSDTVAIAA